MSQPKQPIQKILFGSPGTGKSYQIQNIATQQLGIPFDEVSNMLKNTVKTVFHPEYTYADFMGKLLPLTQGRSIVYKFYPGHFLRILGMAYRALIEGKEDNYLLVIDELNRGNAAAIFGTVFQLLDRQSDGWSSYEVDISRMELIYLLESILLEPEKVTQTFKIVLDDDTGEIEIRGEGGKKFYSQFCQDESKILRDQGQEGFRVYEILKESRISIPSNLSIIGTINTSDESIYYLDSAFKRRWDWEYVPSPCIPINNESFSQHQFPQPLRKIFLVKGEKVKGLWPLYILGLNEFIKSNSKIVRRIEDKQIGWWFIKPTTANSIDLEQLKDKLMFYLWDSVFTRDKKPLEVLLSKKLVLYSDFLDSAEEFMDKIHQIGSSKYKYEPDDEDSETDFDDIPF